MQQLRTLQSLAETIPETEPDAPSTLALTKESIVSRSRRELAERADALARGLASEGVERGDPVAIVAANSPEWIMACLAIARAGAVVVPLDVQFGKEPLRHALDDSGARWVFTTSSERQRLERLGEERRLAILDDDESESSWMRIAREDGIELPRVEPSSRAAIFYTSGTTGAPKGVPLTHENLVFQLDALLETGWMEPGDRFLLPLPLHHVYPFSIGMLTALAARVPIIFPHALTGPEILRAAREGDATTIVGVPRLYRALFSGIEAQVSSKGRAAAMLFRASLSLSAFLLQTFGLRMGRTIFRPLHRRFGDRLRVLASGGSALERDLARRLEALGWRVTVGYGLTETSPLLTIDRPDSYRLGAVGRPLPGVDIRIDPVTRDDREEDRDQDDGGGAGKRDTDTGEIVVRGPNVFSGYHGLPEETRAAFTEDGWFRTGDLGRIDNEGFLHVLGRASTMIVTEGGENVRPEEVEEAYARHPVIREIGVLERERRLVGLIVAEVAVIRRRGNGRFEDEVEAAIQSVSKELPSYQRLSDFALSGEPLERTRLGKLRRHILPERYEEAKSGGAPDEGGTAPPSFEEAAAEEDEILASSAAREVWKLLGERYRGKRLALETSPQLGLGVDSLEWLDLTMEIARRTRVELDEEALAGVETVRDLLEAVASREGKEEEGKLLTDPVADPDAILTDDQRHWLEPRGRLGSFVAGGFALLNRGVMRAFYRLEVRGEERLPEGSFVLAANHASSLDPFAIAAALDDRRLGECYWAGWTGIAFTNPVTRWLSRLAKVVPIDPDRAVISSLAFGAAVLERRKNLVWFPEGHRSTDGNLQAFQPGIGRLLGHHRTIVVPVYIEGAHEALPPGRAIPRGGRIRLTFGEPVDPEILEEEGEGESPPERIANALHDRVARLGAERPASQVG